MQKRRGLLLSLLLAASMLAGCADEAPDPTTSPGEDGTPGVEEPSGPDPVAGVEAPDWEVGDWFGHHLTYGESFRGFFDDDGSGEHINVVVTDDLGTSYSLLSENQRYAQFEAMYDMHLIGTINRDLSTTAYGGGWNLYQFPMRDGMTWQGKAAAPFLGAIDLTFTATWSESLDTRTYGDMAGFAIVGANADGDVVVDTDYIPEIGWYGTFVFYDPFISDFEDEYFRIDSMGFGANYTGELWDYSATSLLNTYWELGATEDGSVTVQPPVPTPFNVETGFDAIMGYHFAYAYVGASTTSLIDPAGQHWERQAMSTSDSDFDFDLEFLELFATAGQWGYGGVGAGLAVGGGIAVWGVNGNAVEWPPA